MIIHQLIEAFCEDRGTGGHLNGWCIYTPLQYGIIAKEGTEKHNTSSYITMEIFQLFLSARLIEVYKVVHKQVQLYFCYNSPLKASG